MRTTADEHGVRGRGVKLTNTHAKALGLLYDDVPKAVLAAIAVEMLRDQYAPGIPLDTEGGAQGAKDAIVAEWVHLHRLGIVPQEPPKDWRNENTETTWRT